MHDSGSRPPPGLRKLGGGGESITARPRPGPAFSRRIPQAASEIWVYATPSGSGLEPNLSGGGMVTGSEGPTRSPTVT